MGGERGCLERSYGAWMFSRDAFPEASSRTWVWLWCIRDSERLVCLDGRGRRVIQARQVAPWFVPMATAPPSGNGKMRTDWQLMGRYENSTLPGRICRSGKYTSSERRNAF